ncbi:MAG: chalcone synthase [Planctomycetota bacterium]|nr:MAG: chalcone synthase [Planctomycetota bacterium]
MPERTLRALVRRSGVNTRRVVLPTEGEAGLRELLQSEAPRGPGTARRMQLFAQHAPPLAEAAAREALLEARVHAGAITHLVCVSCTGFVAPGLDHALSTALALSPDVQRTQVGFMGCHGALNGLRVAQAFAEQNARHRVLLVAVELCSLHVQTDPDNAQLVSNLLFGDGAAAVLLASEGNGPRHVGGASHLLPDSAELMSWRIGDAGFEMGLSAEVPAVLRATLRPWVDAQLAAHALTRNDVGAWAVHPGGPRILDAVEQALELPRRALAASRELLATRGNMSSPTVLMLLRGFAAADTPRPWVVLAFGPGLSAELALLT